MTQAEAEGQASFGYKPALDGLRAVAVVAVIVYHLDLGWAPGGYLGVDAFFVLSGYLITSLLLVEFTRAGRIDLRAFWVRRVRRLLPAMLLVLTAVALWAVYDMPADRLDRLRGDSLSTLFYGANWRFVVTGQSYFDFVSSSSPLEHMWSLAIEEQFYLVWPLVVFGALAAGRGRTAALAGICVVGTVASVVTMALLYDASDPSRAYYGTDARAHALLVGSLLAIALRGKVRWGTTARRSVHASGALGALAVVAFVILVPDTASWMYRGGFALFALVVAVVITAVVAPGRSPVNALLALAPLVWIGRISYGLYLWHWPVITALSEGRTGLDGVTLASLRVLTTLAIAAASYYVVEQPIRRGALGRRRARVATPLAIAGVATALVLVTASAAPPPAYLQHAGDVEQVDRGLLAASRSAPTPPSTPPPSPGASLVPHRVLLVGDSTAASLLPGLEPEAARRGIAFFPGPIPGCGVIAGTVLGDEGAPIDWATPCSAKIVQKQSEWVNQMRPDLVVWYSSWETADRLVDDDVVRFGTEEGDRAVLRLMDEAVGRLTSTGARVALLTVPPRAATPEIGEPPAESIRDVAMLNALLRRYADDNPHRAFVVDLASVVCPGGSPCPTHVEGVELRPEDGAHYDGDGPAWVASRLLDQVLQPRAMPVAAPRVLGDP